MDSPENPPAAATGTRTQRTPLEGFVEAYWADREADAVRPLSDYLRRFPGDDLAIAEEYLALERDDEPAPDPTSDSSFEGAPGLGLPLGVGPERIGHYRIVREIGRGGQGEVYLAEDSRLKRKVALKVLSTLGPVSEPLLGRFRREAEVASRLDDPGICTVFEAGNADGVPFIAMRYVEGETLAEKLRAATEDGHVGAMPLVAAGGDEDASDTRSDVMRLVHLFEKAARSLDHAHHAGITHRDIKPGNIVVTPEGEPVLVDFGLARDEGSDQPTLTISGDLFGTPAYMSPEQLSGGRVTTDARSDIYALGVTLFECLTLERPFDGATREILFQNILDKPAPDPTRANPDVGADLGTVVRVCLEKSRDHRYDSALALAEDLRRVRLREPIRARPAGPLVRLRRWTERNPALASAVFGIFLLLAAGLTATLILLDQKARALHALGEKKREADGTLEALAKALDRSDGYRLAHESLNACNNDPALALLLGIEAAERTPGDNSDNALRTALEALREERTLTADFGAVARLTFSADGRDLLAVAPYRASRLWEVDSGKTRQSVAGGRVFGPGGELVPAPGNFALVRGADGSARLEGRGFGVPLAAELAAIAVANRTAWNRPSSNQAAPNQKVSKQAASRLAVPMRDRSVALLDAADGRVIRVIAPATGADGLGDPVEIAFDPTGRRLAVSSTRGVRLFHAGTGKALAIVDVNVNARPPLVWSPDGLRLAAAAPENAVVVWDLTANERRILLEGHRAAVTAISFSRDGTRVVTASRDHTARIWEVRSGKAVAVLRGHRKPLTAVALSADAGHAATAALDGTVRIWRAEPRLPLRLPAGNLLRASFGPGAAVVLMPGGNAGGEALLIDAATAQPRVALHGHAGTVRLARFGPGGARAVTYAEDGTVRVWSLTDGRLLCSVPGFGKAPHHACLSADGRRLLTVTGKTAELWDAVSGRRVSELAGHTDTITFAEFSPDSARIATSSDDRTARVWRGDDGALVAECRGHRDLVFPARFAADGKALLTASSDGTARIWDPATGKGRRVLARHRAAVLDARFDPAGKRVITLCSDGTARIWDTASGRSLHALEHGDDDLITGRFGPRGRLAVTASGGTIHLWDADSGVRIAVMTHGGSGSTIQDLAFTADATALVSLGRDGSVRRWATDPLPEARRRRPRTLSEPERERYRVGPIEMRVEK